MAQWYYYNENGERIGQIDDRKLQELAYQKAVTRETRIEHESGRIVLARKIRGLKFPEETPIEENPFSDPMPAAENPFATSVPPAPVPKTVSIPPPPPKQVFCTNCGKSVLEQAAACMSCGARPAGHKKFCRQCGVAINPEQVVCIKCGSAIADLMLAHPTPRVPLDAKQRKARIHFWTMLCTIFFVLCTLISTIGTCLDAAVPYFSQQAYESQFRGTPSSDRYWLKFLGQSEEKVQTIVQGRIALFCFILATITGVPYLCCYYFYLLRLWEEIPGEFARTTPGNAAGLALIPFFNWYWQFIAFLGLYKDMNKTAESYGMSCRFKELWIDKICYTWISLDILGFIIPFIFSPGPSQIIWTIGWAVGCFSITVPAYWTISKNVLKFIDSKSSIGK